MKTSFYILFLTLLFTCTILAQNGGYALKFDGNNGKVSIPLNTELVNSTITFEIWFCQVSAQSGTKYIADFRSVSGSNKRRVMPFLNSSEIGIYCAPNTDNDDNSIFESTGITVSPGVWYHIAITINASALNMYVNGKLYIEPSEKFS
jgi:hypothetical protein